MRGNSDNVNNRRKSAIGFIIVGILFTVMIITLFLNYKSRLNESFEYLIENNLAAYAENQRIEIDYYINDIETTLSAIQIFLHSSAVDPEGEWMSSYLSTLSDTHEWYNISYMPIDQLVASVNSDSPITDTETIDALRADKPVISELRYSERMNGTYLAIALPVSRDDAVIGAIRCLVSADILLNTHQTSYLNDHITPYVVDGSGTIIYSAESKANGVMFTDYLRKIGVDDTSVSKALECFSNGEARSCKLAIPKMWAAKYFTAVRLDIRDLSMIYISSDDDASMYANNVLDNTVSIGIALILFTVLLSAAIFLILMRQRRCDRIEYNRFSTIARFSDVVLFDYTFKTDMLAFTDNVRDFLPVHSSTIRGRDLKNTGLVHPDDIGNLLRIMTNSDIAHKFTCECRLKGNDGQFFWCECRTQRLAEDNVAVGCLTDIDARKKRELKLAETSARDALTGLLNKSSAEMAIAERMMELEKASLNGVLIMIDIDDFKNINDNYGHAAGDATLARVGSVILNTFRDNDIAGRIGGDEFVVFMGDADLENGSIATKRMLNALKSTAGSQSKAPISLSIGIAETAPYDGAYSRVFAAADQAMYDAKRAGKNQIIVSGKY